jgi:hypothetical protein
VVTLKIYIPIKKRIYEKLLDLTNEEQQTEYKYLYKILLDFVNKQLTVYNNVIESGEIRDIHGLRFEAPINEIKEIEFKLKSKEEIQANLKEDEQLLEIIIGDKLYNKYIDIIKFVTFQNKLNNFNVVWDSINDFTALLVMESVIDQYNKLEQKEYESEMEEELKNIKE